MTRDEIIAQITALAREAGLERILAVHEDGTRTVETMRPDLLERFAELIVRECLHNMENCDGDLDFAIWKTKEHFGVE